MLLFIMLCELALTLESVHKTVPIQKKTGVVHKYLADGDFSLLSLWMKS